MAPTLYMNKVSPPVRSVLLCAKASDVELNLAVVDMFGLGHLKPEYLKINPQHTIPSLVDDDGFTFWDSHAIMPYLVRKYGKDKSLYPEDLKKKAVIDQRLHFDSNVLFNKGVVIVKGILREGKTYITDEQKTGLLEAYDFVEKFLEHNKWIAGDELSVADFSFVTSISSWNILVPLDTTRHAKIITWLKRMEALPYYNEVNLEGLELFSKTMLSILKANK